MESYDLIDFVLQLKMEISLITTLKKKIIKKKNSKLFILFYFYNNILKNNIKIPFFFYIYNYNLSTIMMHDDLYLKFNFFLSKNKLNSLENSNNLNENLVNFMSNDIDVKKLNNFDFIIKKFYNFKDFESFYFYYNLYYSKNNRSVFLDKTDYFQNGNYLFHNNKLSDDLIFRTKLLMSDDFGNIISNKYYKLVSDDYESENDDDECSEDDTIDINNDNYSNLNNYLNNYLNDDEDNEIDNNYEENIEEKKKIKNN